MRALNKIGRGDGEKGWLGKREEGEFVVLED